jgi:hypothetical protein
VAVIYVKIKSQKLPGVTEETEEKYQLKWPAFGTITEPETNRYNRCD